MHRPCGFSLPPKLNALDRRVMTESELARAGRSWCWSPLVCQAAAPHVSSIFNPASGRTSMHDSSAGQPREKYSRAAPVFAASHAPRSFLSFPRGVPLLASLEHSRPCRSLQRYPTSLHVRQRSWGPLNPSQVYSHRQADSRFRITGPTCRSSTSSFTRSFSSGRIS
jgi:hypothetical protein